MLIIVLISEIGVPSIFGSAGKFEQWMDLDRFRTREYLLSQDYEELELYKKNFFERFNKNDSDSWLVPPIIHWIWLGEKEFPESSIKNVVSWKKHHPNWKLIFWTDRKDRQLPLPDMEVRYVSEFEWEHTGRLIDQTKNYGEKSDLLRYEILWKWGGLYIDHDIFCLTAFSELNQQYPFYVFLEPPHYIPGYPLAIFVNNGCIGSSIGSPIIKKTMEEIYIRFSESKAKKFSSEFSQVLCRTFQPFSSALRESLKNKECDGIVFPASFLYVPEHISKNDFDSRLEAKTLFANHTNDGLWFKQEHIQKTRKEIFKEIYKEDLWEYYPGSGREGKKRESQPYLNFLKQFLKEHPEIKVVLDIGCGDGANFANFDWEDDREYIGIDIVGSVLEKHPFKDRKNCRLKSFDFLSNPLPKADLILCKDVFIHLKNEEIERALDLFLQYPYTLLVNDYDNLERKVYVNTDIETGGYRCLDLLSFPYFLEPEYAKTYTCENVIKHLLVFAKRPLY